MKTSKHEEALGEPEDIDRGSVLEWGREGEGLH